MRVRFAEEGPDPLVAALGGRMLSLDDFCGIRLIELLFHLDDLAAGVGVPCPATSVEGRTIVIDVSSALPACSTVTGRCSAGWPARSAARPTYPGVLTPILRSVFPSVLDNTGDSPRRPRPRSPGGAPMGHREAHGRDRRRVGGRVAGFGTVRGGGGRTMAPAVGADRAGWEDGGVATEHRFSTILTTGRSQHVFVPLPFNPDVA